jgi:hypothetical protein
MWAGADINDREARDLAVWSHGIDPRDPNASTALRGWWPAAIDRSRMNEVRLVRQSPGRCRRQPPCSACGAALSATPERERDSVLEIGFERGPGATLVAASRSDAPTERRCRWAPRKLLPQCRTQGVSRQDLVARTRATRTPAITQLPIDELRAGAVKARRPRARGARAERSDAPCTVPSTAR